MRATVTAAIGVIAITSAIAMDMGATIAAEIDTTRAATTRTEEATLIRRANADDTTTTPSAAGA